MSPTIIVSVLLPEAFADDTQCKSALYLAKEVENQIQRALKESLGSVCCNQTNGEILLPFSSAE